MIKIKNSYKKIMFSVIFMFVAVLMLGVNSQKVIANTDTIEIQLKDIEGNDKESIFLENSSTVYIEYQNTILNADGIDSELIKFVDVKTKEIISNNILWAEISSSFAFSEDNNNWFTFNKDAGLHYAIINSWETRILTEDAKYMESIFPDGRESTEKLYLRHVNYVETEEQPQRQESLSMTNNLDNVVDVGTIKLNGEPDNTITFGKSFTIQASTQTKEIIKDTPYRFADLFIEDIRQFILSFDNGLIIDNATDQQDIRNIKVYETTLPDSPDDVVLEFDGNFTTNYGKPVNMDLPQLLSELVSQEMLIYGKQYEHEGKRPAISGLENFATNVDDARPVSYFQSFLSAYDYLGNDITESIYIETDNYTPNTSVLGTHKVVFSVEDADGLKTSVEAYIRVFDMTKPVITGSTSITEISYKDTFNIEQFKNTLNVSDNYDTLTNADITVKEDEYTSNKVRLGTYNITFSIKDNSGNEGIFVKSIRVFDDVEPTISGPVTVAASNATIVTESDVRGRLTAHDDIDGNVTPKIKLVEDNYTGNGNKVGSYTIKYSVSDNAGNIAYHTVTVIRSNAIPPTIWIEDGVTIKTNPTTPLTHEQIISILQATGQVSNSTTTNFRFTYDEYTGNEEEPGIYAVSINAKSVDGSESIHNMSITVLQDEDDGGIDVGGKDWFKDNKNILIVSGAVLGLFGLAIVFRKKR